MIEKILIRLCSQKDKHLSMGIGPFVPRAREEPPIAAFAHLTGSMKPRFLIRISMRDFSIRIAEKILPLLQEQIGILRRCLQAQVPFSLVSFSAAVEIPYQTSIV